MQENEYVFDLFLYQHKSSQIEHLLQKPKKYRLY